MSDHKDAEVGGSTPVDWKSTLTPLQYHVLRERGTERAWTSPLLEEHRPGLFRCAGCGQELFTSETKYNSGSGWPSFWQVLSSEAIETTTDRSHGMVRTEVNCRRCGGHLGHVFEDGPAPTGLRYCMNGASLKFEGRSE
jgi:peptide-methionine (R)-S-oxide reductase